MKTGPEEIRRSQTITYQMFVWTPIDRPLREIEVIDPRCDEPPTRHPDERGNNDEFLESGEMWSFRCSHRVRGSDPNPFPNTATASGVDQAGNQFFDEDSHLVDLVPPPRIRIVKNGPQYAVDVGDRIVYNLKVSIPVDMQLHEIRVKDSQCDYPPRLVKRRGGDTDETLEFGETWTYRCHMIARYRHVPSVRNTATATGTDDFGTTVRDKDDHEVDVWQVLHRLVQLFP